MDTTRIPPDFKEFLRLLVVHEVKFLLIGGYAVNAFGYVRNSAAMDIWIASGGENESRVVRAVREFGFTGTPDTILHEPNAMLRMGVPPLRIELLKSISGVEFDDCWSRSVTFESGDLTIPMISLEDLKKNKRAAGRAQDLLDVEELS